MDEIWLEAEINGNTAFITDWTEYMRGWFVDAPQTYMQYEREFIGVFGKFLTIHVKGFGSDYKRAKSFAIWYITNRESVSTYRLDCIYNERIRKAWCGKRLSADERLQQSLHGGTGE